MIFPQHQHPPAHLQLLKLHQLFLQIIFHSVMIQRNYQLKILLNQKNPKKATSSSNKKPKLQTPTVPLKELVRNYIESNPTLHARILCYEPIDFEEFHKQIKKTDLNVKIASKELMQCLDDQCITFTLRSRKGAFSSVMRAKRRHK